MALDWQSIGHSKASRLKAYNWLINDTSRIELFLAIVKDKAYKDYYKVMWALEYVSQRAINVLLPFLPQILELAKVENKDEALRPFSKICERVVNEHYKAQTFILKNDEKKILIELCFDWLITDQKAAVKAYAMTSLYYLGIDYKWVHPALLDYLNEHYQSESPSFRARARQVFKLLNV